MGQPQWVHVAIWYIPGPQSSSHVLTVGPMYVLYRYLDPWGAHVTLMRSHPLRVYEYPNILIAAYARTESTIISFRYYSQICIHTYVYMRTHTFTYTYIHIYIYIFMYVYIHRERERERERKRERERERERGGERERVTQPETHGALSFVLETRPSAIGPSIRGSSGSLLFGGLSSESMRRAGASLGTGNINSVALQVCKQHLLWGSRHI